MCFVVDVVDGGDLLVVGGDFIEGLGCSDCIGCCLYWVGVFDVLLFDWLYWFVVCVDGDLFDFVVWCGFCVVVFG